MKYIHTDLGIILFPAFTSHKDMAKHFKNKVYSAGFVSFDYESIDCWGKSESLNLQSDPLDTKLLRIMAEL